MPAEITRVAIVGGGAGGLELAIRLARATRSDDVIVTLIDRSPFHVWKPRLHEVAVGLPVNVDEEVSFAEQALRHGFLFILGEMQSLDPVARAIAVGPVMVADQKIVLQAGVLLPPRTVAYDVAVLAIGSTVNDFGIPGVANGCFTLDTADGAQRLHSALLAFAIRVHGGIIDSMRVVVVGAGTTGVEFAGELRSAAKSLDSYRSLMKSSQLKIVLVEMGDRPLPSADVATSNRICRTLEAQGVDMRYGSKVQEVTAGQLILEDRSRIDADIIVWASGIQGSGAVKQVAGVRVGKGGRIDVDSSLHAIAADGQSLDSLYCMGDCAACYQEGQTAPLGATAQVAEQQARFLAQHLAKDRYRNSTVRFRFRNRGVLVSLGGRFAIGDITVPGRGRGPLIIEGAAAKIAYAALYRAHLFTIFGWSRTLLLTVANCFKRSAMPSFKLHW